MSGGSLEPETDKDQQCPHCTLYFSAEGIGAHRDNCPLRDLPLKVTREGESGDGETPDPSGDGVDPTGEAPPPEGVDPADGVGADPSEGVTPEGLDPERATDGGEGLGLEGPPETSASSSASADDVEDDQDDPDGVECPNCETNHDVDPSDLVDGKQYVCDNCGDTLTWRSHS